MYNHLVELTDFATGHAVGINPDAVAWVEPAQEGIRIYLIQSEYSLLVAQKYADTTQRINYATRNRFVVEHTDY